MNAQCSHTTHGICIFQRSRRLPASPGAGGDKALEFAYAVGMAAPQTCSSNNFSRDAFLNTTVSHAWLRALCREASHDCFSDCKASLIAVNLASMSPRSCSSFRPAIWQCAFHLVRRVLGFLSRPSDRLMFVMASFGTQTGLVRPHAMATSICPAAKDGPDFSTSALMCNWAFFWGPSKYVQYVHRESSSLSL